MDSRLKPLILRCFLSYIAAGFLSPVLGADRETAKKEAFLPEQEDEAAVFDDGSMIDEVLSSSKGPKIYDWRNANWELELGFDDINEGTVFTSRGWHVGAGFSLGGGWQMRTGLRRFYLRSSRAGDDLEKTPFRQPAQPSRYEIFALMGYSLMEGRVSTRVTPWVSDFEHVLSVEGGAHFVHPTTTIIPTKEGKRDRVPGQSVAVSVWVLDLGLRYQIYLPSGFGVFVSSTWGIPIRHIEGPVGQWVTWSGGAVYAFAPAREGKK